VRRYNAVGAELFTVMSAESEFDSSAAEGNRAAAAAAAPLYNNLALCMSRRGAWAQAEEACTECLDLAPGDVKALLRRGAARAELGRWEEAEADLARALAAQPRSASVAGGAWGGGGGGRGSIRVHEDLLLSCGFLVFWQFLCKNQKLFSFIFSFPQGWFPSSYSLTRVPCCAGGVYPR
jgi:tetratricopeptide (TPR) repeat protein